MEKNNLRFCKTCYWWKNEQSELDYRTSYGFCIHNLHKFNTDDGLNITVLDRNNIKPKGIHTHEFENQQAYQHIETSRYCLVTSEDYGCINYEKE